MIQICITCILPPSPHPLIENLQQKIRLTMDPKLFPYSSKNTQSKNQTVVFLFKFLGFLTTLFGRASGLVAAKWQSMIYFNLSMLFLIPEYRFFSKLHLCIYESIPQLVHQGILKPQPTTRHWVRKGTMCSSTMWSFGEIETSGQFKRRYVMNSSIYMFSSVRWCDELKIWGRLISPTPHKSDTP